MSGGVKARSAMEALESAAPAMTARSSLADRIWAARDRMLARPGFQRWVARFPLTRSFARRKELALFGIVSGFVRTQVLTTSVRLGLFEVLREGPLPAPAVAARIGLELDPTERLLAAAVSLDLVSRRSGGRYGLGDLGAAVVGTPAFAAIIEHNAIFYSDLAEPVALLRGEQRQTKLSQFWAYAGNPDPAALEPAEVARYTAFMAASQTLIASDVLDAYPFDRHRLLLDVGGGDGAFLSAVGQRHSSLGLMLFELPAVAISAERRLADVGLSARTTIVPGNFMADEIPAGADLVTLNRVLLDHDDTTVLRLLSSIRRSIAPGGTVLIAEPLAGTPTADVYFGFYLLAMGRGRSRGLADMVRLLAAAGFVQPREVATFRPTLTSVVVASAPTK